MKKLLVSLLALMMLSGCSDEVAKTPERWAVEYVVQRYESDCDYYDMSCSQIIGYSTLEYTLYDELFDDYLEGGNSGRMYLVNIIDDNGGSYLFNVIIVYKTNAFDDYFGYKYIHEQDIVDVDIREAIARG